MESTPGKFYPLASQRLTETIARQIAHNVSAEEIEELATALHRQHLANCAVVSLKQSLAAKALDRFRNG